tara:strand:+ start:117 stop:1034 length:918 start_codon:yes stop_codon:yes gene_type:complete
MKKYFISFGNKNFKNQLDRIFNEAKEVGWFDEVIAYHPYLIRDFIKDHEEFINNNPRGFGYWIWKPYIILKQLLKMNDGDYLFYTDAGSRILPHREDKFNEYLDKLDEQPILINGEGSASGCGGYTQQKFIKLSLLKEFNLENNNLFLNSSHSESGMIAIRKCKESTDLIKKWSELIIKDNYILTNDDLGDDKQLDGFIEHRHDQSILNILLWLKGYKALWFENCYGTGPFFSGRQTDDGYREFCADWFRAEPDYINNSVHGQLGDYVNSKPNKEWYKKQKDYNPNTMFNEEDYLEYRKKIQLNL